MDAHPSPAAAHARKRRRAEVRLRPLGQHLYEIRRGGEAAGVGSFHRRQTRTGASAEAWIKWNDGTVVELRESYFADFVRWVRAYA